MENNEPKTNEQAPEETPKTTEETTQNVVWQLAPAQATSGCF